MILPHHIIFAIGFLLPVVAWITLGLSAYDRWRYGKHSSPVFIPIIGPLIISLWIVAMQYSPLWIPLAWVSDIGTLAFLRVVPRIIREEWDTSWWTRVSEFRAARDNWTARLTLHSTGAYHLVYKNQNHVDQLGLKEISIAGKFSRRGDEIHLKGVRGDDHDLKLIRQPDGCFRAVAHGNWADATSFAASFATSWFFQEA